MVGSERKYFTDKPLVVFGATGLLGSEFVFMSIALSFSKTIVLHSSSMERLEGLRDEIMESGHEELQVLCTTSVEEACAKGGYIFYARSVRAAKQSREEMLLDNAPMAVEVAEALSHSREPIERVVCVSNPSDLIGLLLLVCGRLLPHQVYSLSALDTLRLRRAVMRYCDLSSVEVEQAFTLGSHDNSMAPMVDSIRILKSGSRYSFYEYLKILGYDQNRYDLLRENLIREVRGCGLNIYKLRGHTAYQSPAYLSLCMMMATDDVPFIYPISSYHHSDEYPYLFGTFPSFLTGSGLEYSSLICTERDHTSLRIAFDSIARQRDILIEKGYLPPMNTWHTALHTKMNVPITIDTM